MSLSVSSREFSDWLDDEAHDFVLNLTYKVWDGIISLTPVDTGQARASWNMSKNVPNYSTIDEGDGLAAPSAPQISFTKGEYPLIFIANGKDYIQYLEEGWSSQAPYGMVQITLNNLSI